MKASAALVKQLRTLDCPKGQERQLRALFVAQAVALNTPLHIDVPVSEDSRPEDEAHHKAMLKFVNEVNEYMPLDVRLTIDLYGRLRRVRSQMVTGVTDPALLKLVLNSSEVESQFSDELVQVKNAFLANRGYTGAHAAISEQMATEFSNDTADDL